MSANVMRTLESGVTQPERGRREIGLDGKFTLGQQGDRSRQGANHGGHPVVQPKRRRVQRAAQQLAGESVTNGESMRACRSKKENKTGMPDRLKAGIEQLSGYSMEEVRVHYNSEKPAQLQAQAYAQGTEIHVAPGQQKHLPHEAWHVVQQKQGRVKALKQERGVWRNDDQALEREADRMGEKAAANNKNSTNRTKGRKPIIGVWPDNESNVNRESETARIKWELEGVSNKVILPVQRVVQCGGEVFQVFVRNLLSNNIDYIEVKSSGTVMDIMREIGNHNQEVYLYNFVWELLDPDMELSETGLQMGDEIFSVVREHVIEFGSDRWRHTIYNFSF
ncbi:MAG: DUF4157 domain-containing protein [Moorea sp. SIO4G3]|nr:DUF4157 domain-containing protein [Moorena sp. SIO4G3]